MSAPDFYDGHYHAANRTNEASGRSWHIPAEPSRLGFRFWTAIQLIVCIVPVACLWAVLG